jgi:aerobic carbon-monoxide dehydrogenase small subunit
MVATQKSSRTVVNTTINGEPIEFIAEPRQSLLECLRDVVGLTGTKEGCNDGNCGACSVQMDDRIVNSCLVLGVEAEGAQITTVEGIATPQGLHPLQTAFLEQAALQCGICTPGFLVAAKALLEKEPNPTEERVRFWLAGNLCRCTGYDKIVRAVMEASQMMQKAPVASNGAATNGKAHANGRSKRNGKA